MIPIKDTFYMQLEHQPEGVEFLVCNKKALLGDDVGTGKTLQAIHACMKVNAQTVLVICTANIKGNWKKEAIKWGYSPLDIYIVSRENVKNLPVSGFFIINYDLIWRVDYARVLSKRNFDVLICDEAHALQTMTSKRSKAVFLAGGYCDMSTYNWMVTATPILTRPVNLYPMLNKLCPELLGEFKNFIPFTKRFCKGYEGKWGWDATGAQNLEQLAGILKGFMLRRTRDVLPAITLQKIYMPCDDKLQKTIFSGGENESVRRLVGEGKVDPAIEHILTILEQERKIVVFAYHTNVVEGLREGLRAFNPAVLYGKTTKRQVQIDKFIEDDSCRVFIGQVDAAGEGIDGLQTVASFGVFVETSPIPGRVRQAIGRLQREGQENKVIFQFLVVEGTVDEQNLDNTILKDKNIATVLEDEKSVLDFNTKQKEDSMSVESELGRIADLLEVLVGGKPIGEGTAPIESNDAVTEKAATPKRVRKSRAKTPVAETVTQPSVVEPVNNVFGQPVETPAVVAEVVPGMAEEVYKEFMTNASSRIQKYYNSGEKARQAKTKVNSAFRAAYPQETNIMSLKPEHFEGAIKVVKKVLVELGVN